MKVYNLLNRKEKWLKGALYATRRPGPPSKTNPQIKWCVLGAMIHCYGDVGTPELHNAVEKLRAVVGYDYVNWNNADSTTFRMLRAAVKKAGI